QLLPRGDCEATGAFAPVAAHGGTIAVLYNPTDSTNEVQGREVQEAARATGQSIDIVNASNVGDFDGAFAEIMQHRASGLFVIADPFSPRRGRLLVAFAAKSGTRASYGFRDFRWGGGLMS